MNKTIGTCSICGGPVQVPDVWMGIVPPTPTCARCGATARDSFGPLIPMKPFEWRTFGDGKNKQPIYPNYNQTFTGGVSDAAIDNPCGDDFK